MWFIVNHNYFFFFRFWITECQVSRNNIPIVDERIIVPIVDERIIEPIVELLMVVLPNVVPTVE